ncbi:hypothetical protein EXIGLDRAFT_840627 [Exidia glandulosa HHB12029]|uniref:SWIM-type domain-containing protein n=1 Tax=Exidia glandulosa HHB12029 TaxID=1314781 RepID=A0A165ZXI9_EXIGL|nr:hypothetical protein EXIGLDRAFT_840627 [Exidia glandulosa HHB12029]
MLNLQQDIAQLADAAIDAFEPGNASEERVQALRHFFPDSLIIASFDLIDRGCVNKYVAPWRTVAYRVAGSTDRYAVTTDPPFCSCPAFAYGVLISGTHSLCKHVLAVRLAERLDKCREFKTSAEEFFAMIVAD